MSISNNKKKELFRRFFKQLMRWGPVPKTKFEAEENFYENLKDKDIKIVSLVPHHLNLNGLLIPKPKKICRVDFKEEMAEFFTQGNFLIPVLTKEYCDIKGLPDPKENTIYIVSKIVKDAMIKQKMFRNDVFSVNTTRNGNGTVRMAKSLIGIKEF